MRILMTGGSGFLGAWLIRRLARRGVAVRIFDTNTDRRVVNAVAGENVAGLEWVTGDVRDQARLVLACATCDAIVHLAGVLTPVCRLDPVRGAEINLLGSLNVFAAARKQEMRSVVYASSIGVYGPEDEPHYRPVTHYGAFKLAVEGCARAFWHDTGIASIGFRPSVVYGPGREAGASAGPTLACRAAARGESFTIPFSGRYGFIYVDDVAQAFEQAVMTSISGATVYNLVGEIADVDTVAAQIERLSPGARINAAGASLNLVAEIDEAGLDVLLPGRSRTSLEQGLAATLEHYRSAISPAYSL